jgi:hypothetical protein
LRFEAPSRAVQGVARRLSPRPGEERAEEEQRFETDWQQGCDEESYAAGQRDYALGGECSVCTIAKHTKLQAEGIRYSWTWTTSRPPQQLPPWVITSQAIDPFRLEPLDRLTRRGHRCWHFLDTIRNHSRRWCSMKA